jgi:hypothetical protein
VRKRRAMTVRLHRTSRQLDGGQAIPVGQGTPNSVCIEPQLGDDLHTQPIAPDIIGRFQAPQDATKTIHKILSDNNGICHTPATAPDSQVIKPDMGEPFSICIPAGPDGKVHTPPVGDDRLVPAGLTSGPNGICETRVGFDTPPTNAISLGQLQAGRVASIPFSRLAMETLSAMVGGPGLPSPKSGIERAFPTEKEREIWREWLNQKRRPTSNSRASVCQPRDSVK